MSVSSSSGLSVSIVSLEEQTHRWYKNSDFSNIPYQHKFLWFFSTFESLQLYEMNERGNE